MNENNSPIDVPTTKEVPSRVHFLSTHRLHVFLSILAGVALLVSVLVYKTSVREDVVIEYDVINQETDGVIEIADDYIPVDVVYDDGFYEEVPVSPLPSTSPYSVTEYGSVTYVDPQNGRYTELYGINQATFEYVGGDYAKDALSVYYKGVVLPGINPTKCTINTLDLCTYDQTWKQITSPYELDVDWYTQPNEAEYLLREKSCLAGGYEVGKINNGPLVGKALFLQSTTICDMWCGGKYPLDVTHYIQHGSSLIPIDGTNGFTIKGVTNLPTQLAIPNSSLSLLRDGLNGFGGYAGAIENDESRGEKVMDHAVAGSIYRDDYACFASDRKDGIEVMYELDFPYTDDSGVLAVTFNDGKVNEDSYQIYESYGSCMNYVDTSTFSPNSQLTEVGTFFDGSKVYRLAYDQDEKLRTLYTNPNTLASYDAGKNKYSYNEFISYRPYLYWQDPFGGWVEFLNRRFETAAEKCKPVIYLYPEQEGEFSVKVEPNGGFTKTIPEYGNGWNVRSTPQSLITDTATGIAYPYLYWEGINTGIPTITEGWVVPTDTMETFLVEKLTLLGMNEKEIADFNEYWIDRLKTEGANQYKIMFVPQEKFEQLAPLTVTGDETPRTIIRVMMYAQPATATETLAPQVLPPTPKRQGFTVIEWGGALLN